jgi:hypothetical protein
MVEKEKRFSPGSFWLLAALSKICDEELIFIILGQATFRGVANLVLRVAKCRSGKFLINRRQAN